MSRDTDLANRLRAEGLRVVEIDGWQTRGADNFDGQAHVSHHTAGGANGAAPSLNAVIYGFAGSAPGPLANVLQSREDDGNDIVYVVAAGKANHAGTGGWNGVSGNQHAWGNEIEHVGTEPLPDHRRDIADRVAAACLRGMGATDGGMHCQHFEWSWPPGSKIDVSTDVDPNDWRNRTTAVLKGGTTDTDEDDDDMTFFIERANKSGPNQGIFVSNTVWRRHVNPNEWKRANELAAFFGTPPPVIWPLDDETWNSIPVAA